VSDEMQTTKLHILPTDNTPGIILDPEGIIKIKGKGMALSNIDVSGQIMSWLDDYVIDPAEITYVSIAFEYLNSFCATRLVSILRKISQVVMHHGKYIIHWYYEEDDEDILERGEYISDALNMPVTFIMTYDIKNCAG
jgi:hypothetical protein